ncbi:MAG: hypothetical protein ACOYO1_13575 [Bacteroidales bacterium]
MEDEKTQKDLFEKVLNKAILKQQVYKNTFETAKLFKEVIVEIVTEFKSKLPPQEMRISFEYKDKDAFEMELKFAGDVLIFMMHTNVFEFSRNHEIMRTNYIHEDKKRSYCGIINIYNFLADSFKYNRENDVGYLIGRVFINCENHFYIEGKKELGLIYNNFANNEMNKEAARSIVENAILYTSNFDLLTPPYDEVKEVSVFEIQANIDNIRLKTGKRLGFKFQADSDNMIG